MPVELPFHRSPHEVAAPREETASSRLSLEIEIDQFQLEEDKEGLGEPLIQVLDLEGELDRGLSFVPLSLLLHAWMATWKRRMR